MFTPEERLAERRVPVPGNDTLGTGKMVYSFNKFGLYKIGRVFWWPVMGV